MKSLCDKIKESEAYNSKVYRNHFCHSGHGVIPATRVQLRKMNPLYRLAKAILADSLRLRSIW
jgi:hypothetical protein